MPGEPFSPSAPTQWSRIRRLALEPGATTSTNWDEAWAYLCRTFRPAMLATVRNTLARIGGGVVRTGEAEDVVQSFLLSCLEKDYLAKADAARGRFRTFVAVCLRRHTTNYVAQRRCAKRSPTSPPLTLVDEADASSDAVADAAWDESFEQEWVSCLIGAALPRVEERSEPNARILRFLVESPDSDPDFLALRMNLDRSQLALRLHRARKMLAEELWEIVKQTITSNDELEEERARLGRLLKIYLPLDSAPSLFGKKSATDASMPTRRPPGQTQRRPQP